MSGFPCIAQGVPHCCAQAVLLSQTIEDWTCRWIPPHRGIVYCQALKLNFVSSALPQPPIKEPVWADKMAQLVRGFASKPNNMVGEENWLCLIKLFPRQTQHTQVYSPLIGNLLQTQVRIPPKSNLVNQWVLLELLTGVEMAQRQLYHQSPPSMGRNKAGNLELIARPAGGSSGWRVSSATLQAALPASVSSRCWPGLTLYKSSCLEWVSAVWLVCILGRRP